MTVVCRRMKGRIVLTVVTVGCCLIVGLWLYQPSPHTTEPHPDFYIPRDDTKIPKSLPVNDFTTFPCLFGSRSDASPRKGFTCVRTIIESIENVPTNTCVPLKILQTTPICVYDYKVDQWVSGNILTKGSWERTHVTNFVKYLQANPNMEFLDLGCNIGVFTLVAAKQGKRGVCVDPIVQNVKMIATSLKLGKISHYVKVIWNAIANTQRLVSLERITGNVGGTEIRDNIGTKPESMELVETVSLDDLLPYFKGKDVAIKMDIQGQELAALQGGNKFFRNVNVKLIQMEFVLYTLADNSEGATIIEIMEEKGFYGFNDINGTFPLNKANWKHWPVDVFFMKKDKKHNQLSDGTMHKGVDS